MVWTDPTDYVGTAIPTTSGAEALNFNTKVTAKLRELFGYLHGSQSLDFLLQTGSTTHAQLYKDFKTQLPDTSGSYQCKIYDSSTVSAVAFDSAGQLRSGKIDASIIDAHFYGNAVVGNKTGNIRLLAPYTFKATEIAASCDDTMGVGASGTLGMRVVNNLAGTIGAVQITPGNSTGFLTLTATEMVKNSIFSFDTVTIGGGTAPGRDVNVEIRGYRTGTIFPGLFSQSEGSGSSGTTTSTTRSKLTWPFAVDSIWNTPVGDGASYIFANLPDQAEIDVDNEYFLIENASYTPVDLWINGNFDSNRCDRTGYVLKTVQVDPALTIADPTPGSQPNATAAILDTDGATLTHVNPITICVAGDDVTAGFNANSDTSIYGDGIRGSHGGSNLSSLGGSIRSGELFSSDPIRHALKVNLTQYELSIAFSGFRWPANTADSYYADGPPSGYQGTVPACRMGALLAIRPSDYSTVYSQMHSDPARKILWTLTYYGAYVVDNALTVDPAFSHYAFGITEGVYNEFTSNMGFGMNQTSASSGSGLDWYNDCMTIFNNLYVIDNNSSTTIGGPGTRLQPLAPPIGD